MNKLGLRVDKVAKTLVSSANKAHTVTMDVSKLKSYNEIAGPKSYPLVGSMFSLKQLGGDLEITEYDRFLFALNEKYGDLVKMNLFGERQVFLFKPEHSKVVYQHEGAIPNRPSLESWILYANRKKYALSLINSQGEEWKKQRSASNPILAKPGTLARYLDTHNVIIDKFLATLTRKCRKSALIVEKFENQLKMLILQMMTLVAFDLRIDCTNESKANEEILELFDKINEYNELTVQLYFSIPFWKYVRTPKWNRFEQASDFICQFSRKYVTEAYEKMKKKCPKQIDTNGLTILEQFYLNREKSKLTLDDIISMMSEFLLASFDTTAATLHFLLTELGTHPDLQEEIYDEVNAAYPRNSRLDADFFSKIPLLRATLKESQRLHSIAPSVSRILNVDIALDNFFIPKKTIFHIGLVNMCYSERYYKNARTFNPKRWLRAEQQNDAAIDPYTSLPFGFGTRMCVGRRLAEQKIFLIVSKLIKNYKIEYIGEKKPPRFRLIKVPGNDLKLKLHPRPAH